MQILLISYVNNLAYEKNHDNSGQFLFNDK